MGGPPSLSGRLRYALGGRLPGHEDWVWHNLTGPHWQLRGLGRILVQLAPFVVAAAFVPGPASLHVLMPLFLVVCGLFIGFAYADNLRDRRLRQHDLPPPDGDWPATPGPSAGGPPR